MTPGRGLELALEGAAPALAAPSRTKAQSARAGICIGKSTSACNRTASKPNPQIGPHQPGRAPDRHGEQASQEGQSSFLCPLGPIVVRVVYKGTARDRSASMRFASR